MIRKRRASLSRYYDKWGPTILCVMLFVATVVNFAFKIREDGWFGGEQRGRNGSGSENGNENGTVVLLSLGAREREELK